MLDPSLQSWDDLRLFVALARSSSLSEAAAGLRLNQSTLSRRLKQLEESLGAQLFERNAQGTTLTRLGRQVLDEAEKVESSVFHFQDALRREDEKVEGKICIALTEGLAIHFFVPKVLPALRCKYPQLQIELNTGVEAADLMRHEADIALRFFRDKTGDLISQRLGCLPRAVLGHRRLLAQLEGRAAADCPWVAAGLEQFEGVFLAQLGEQELQLKTKSYETQLAALRAGLALAVGPLSYTELYPELAPFPTFGKPDALDLYLVTRAAVRRTPRIAAVCQELRQQLAPLLHAGNSPRRQR